MNQRYSIKDIENKFRIQLLNGDLEIPGENYDLICRALQMVPAAIIDRVVQEAYFVVLTLKPACYLGLNSKDLRGKKGIIFLAPDLFDEEQKRKENNCLYPTQIILHEIAHHIMGHADARDDEERAAFDTAADRLAYKWLLGE